jgi:hypothetical protein
MTWYSTISEGAAMASSLASAASRFCFAVSPRFICAFSSTSLSFTQLSLMTSFCFLAFSLRTRAWR